ncbi:DUF2306 domain-containing protein [Dyadobacter chenwenxiniae]|uniref:DUF2306 domain-containing protein n=1 Tax=Dyadobacter chenwenxiniae TaxID=2906456 RepID=A0A9X1PKS1_9BACT|nr:DUF2306 domain-containing protein [Dyadobacter chenwenxiniae]MCF0063232.1 DUF2306 domain-containing protein [Dyadobacter chenwenxiniae]UON85388.1 DUF2306 domain-containing protein [Dyadobacter chenwenxiniae]
MITQTDVPLSSTENTSYSTRILTFTATLWLVVATLGQWIFAAYILLFYGRPALTGAFEKWNRVLPHGYVEGDWKGNFVVGLHLLLALIMVVGGPLQLIPQIRKRLPVIHRLIGRVYVSAAIIVSAAGLIMVWTRGTIGDHTQQISISIQAVYIILFAIISIRKARSRNFKSHRSWSLRLFMVVSGVWFFRVGLMFWILINGAPVGFDSKTFTGPFLTFLAISTYAIPLSLILLEMYFFACRKNNFTLNIGVSLIIFLVTLIMGVGIFGATMGMWLPRI